ncbi:MAG TPA: Clp protease N-terminal domain-containing protein [Blastocatellia bacterium]|nr:Clp protease N-terminal domain-containing protein [Blastocatellia bacterium]
MFETFDNGARHAVYRATLEAANSGNSEIEPEHLLLGLVRADPSLLRAVAGTWTAAWRIRRALKTELRSGASPVKPLQERAFSRASKQVLLAAVQERDRLGQAKTGTRHILKAWFRVVPASNTANGARGRTLDGALLALRKNGVTAASLDDWLAWSIVSPGKVKIPRSRLPLFAEYGDRAKRAIYFAMWEARRFGASQIDVEHILLGLLYEDPELFRIAVSRVDMVDELCNSVEALLRDRPSVARQVADALPLSRSGKEAVESATGSILELNHSNVGTQHLLLAVVRSTGSHRNGGVGFFPAQSSSSELNRILSASGLDEKRLLALIRNESVTVQDRAAAFAKRLVESASLYYVDQHEYIEVSPSEFERLDLNFYEKVSALLSAAGFTLMGDFEDLTATRAYPRTRRFYRTLIGDDGSVVALITHSRRDDLAEFMNRGKRDYHRSVEFETEFSDGRFLLSTTARDPMSKPPQIERHEAEPGTSPEELLVLHRVRITELTDSNPAMVPIKVATVEDLRAGRHRITRLLAEHRAALGGVFSKQELRSLFPNEPQEFIDRVSEEMEHQRAVR